MYRVVVTDMDGTFLHSDGLPSRETLEAFIWLQNQGIKTVVASGRVISSILPLVGPFRPDRILSSNGALVYTGEGEKLSEWRIARDEALWLIRYLQKEKASISYYEVFDHHGIVFTQRKILRPTLAQREWVDEGELIERIEREEITPVKFFIEVNPAMREKLHGLLEREGAGRDLSFTYSGSDNVEAVAKGVSKFRALESVCSSWGIGMDEVIAFGDSGNDLEMIEGVGFGVAMGNGVAKVKKVSRLVTGTNDEDGILPVLSRLFRR